MGVGDLGVLQEGARGTNLCDDYQRFDRIAYERRKLNVDTRMVFACCIFCVYLCLRLHLPARVAT